MRFAYLDIFTFVYIHLHILLLSDSIACWTAGRISSTAQIKFMYIHTKSLARLTAFFIFSLISSTAHSALLELTSWGAQADLTNSDGSAIGYAQIDPQLQGSSGTGRFDSFLHIHAGNVPVEEGFNTNVNPPLHASNTGTYALTNNKALFDQNEALPNNQQLDLRYAPNVTVNGINYLEFALDINEPSGATDRYLAINELRLYSTDDPNLDTYTDDLVNPPTLTNSTPPVDGSVSELVWDMDADAATEGNVDILLDYSLQNGQGTPDFVLLVASSLFTYGDYVSLYMKAGITSYDGVIGEENNNNFEEWGVRGDGGTFTTPSNAVPLPASAWLFGSALMGFLAIRRRKLTDKCS
ncbi:MAG: VPLPA-CTERM sorting domain-containing protein [Sedimenticola sp.]